MKNIKKVIIFIFILVLADISLQAQSIEADIEELLSQYKDAQNIYIEIESRVYEGGKHTTVSSIINRDNGNYLYQLPERIMLINGKYIVIVDKRNHNIIYDVWTKKQAETLVTTQIPSPKEILKKYPSITYKGEKDGIKHYHLHSSKEQISDIDLFFETATKQIKKYIYRYNPKLVTEDIYMEVDFKKININPGFSDSFFSENQFLQFSGSKASAVNQYKGYTVRYLGEPK